MDQYPRLPDRCEQAHLRRADYRPRAHRDVAGRHIILGAGIAIAGACPGTALAQIGAGYRDALFTVAGGIAGAIAYGYLDQPLTAQLADAGQKVSFDKIAGLPFWMAALMLAAALTLLLVVVERSSPWRGETGENVDGLRDSRSRTGQAVDTVTQVNAG